MKHRLAAMVIAITLPGCVEHVALNPWLQPAAQVDEKLPLHAAVVCSPKLLGLQEQAQAGNESPVTYQVPIGETLCDTLGRSVAVYYQAVTRQRSRPARGDFDRVLVFDVKDSDLEVVVHDGGFGRRSNQATYRVSVSIDAFDGRMRRVNRTVVTGYGTRSRGGATGKQVVREAMQTAVQQILDHTAKLLIAGLAEHGGAPSLPASPER